MKRVVRQGRFCAQALALASTATSLKILRSLMGERSRSHHPAIQRACDLTALPHIEQLEERQLLSAAPSFAAGLLTIVGNPSGANTITVTQNGSTDTATLNGAKTTFAANQLSLIQIFDGNASNNTISIDASIKALTMINAGTGHDFISVGGGNTTVIGGNGGDTIIGNGGQNYLFGGSGNDIISGGSGRSLIYAGAGNDTVTGGNISDVIYGGPGNNVINQVSNTVPPVTKPPVTTPPVTTPPVTTPPKTTPPVTTPPVTTPPVTTPPVTTSPAGTPPGLQAKINLVTSSTIYAGMGTSVDAISSKLDVGNPDSARYTWDFGDKSTGSKYNNYDSWSAGHVYNTAGTYTITLTVTDQNGYSSKAYSTIVVKPSNTLKSIYISASGNDNNSGLDSSHAIKSIDKLNTMIASNEHIYFQDGGTYLVNGPLNILTNVSNLEISTYGSGAAPILKYTGSASGWNEVIALQVGTSNITINGLTIDSIYTKNNGEPDGIHPNGTNIVIENCTFLNLTDAINLNTSPTGIIVQDNTAPNPTELYAYFVYGWGSHINIIGNTVANSVQEHVIRIDGADETYVGYNNLTNTGKGVVTVHDGSYAYVAHNTLNGISGVGPLAIQTSSSNSFTWAVFEDNNINGQFLFQPGSDHTVLRNNIIEADNTVAVQIAAYDTQLNWIVTDAEILNNTVIDNGVQGNFLKVQDRASGTVVANNLYTAPNVTIADYQAAPIYIGGTDLSSFALISSNIYGYGTIPIRYAGGINYVNPIWWDPSGFKTPAWWNSQPQVKNNDLFSNVTIGSNNAPASNSAAANGGTSVSGIFNDFNGKLRSAIGITVGAIQL